MRKNISVQPSLVNFRSTIYHREFHNFMAQLDLIEQMLIKSNFEMKFVETYIDSLNLQNPGKARIQTCANYAIQALRCNILRIVFGCSFRETSLLLAASPDLQAFCQIEFCSKNIPSKSKLHEFSKIVPAETLQEFNHQLAIYVSSEEVNAFELDPLDCETLFMDATCVEANIHFPIDWVLMRDAIRTLSKAIACIRKHGLKHRMKDPDKFRTEINSLCMTMTACRRQKDAKKRRKSIFRQMKKLLNKVQEHAKRHRDLLLEHQAETSLSEKQATQIVARIENVIAQLPAAMEQAQQRIIREESVDNQDKVLSFYDDSAKVIIRGKSGAEIEFGNELNIVEQKDGFIVDWQFFEEKTSDIDKLLEMTERYPHQELKCNSLVTDKGYDGSRSRKALEKLFIKNYMAARSPAEFSKQLEDKEFKQVHKRRSQTEPRIAAIKRLIGRKIASKHFALKKCHIGWAVLTHNFRLLARLSAIAQKEKILMHQKSA